MSISFQHVIVLSTGVWIAPDDATIENGCLWVIPGSHHEAVLYPVRPSTSEEYDGAPEFFDYPHSPDEAVEATRVVLFSFMDICCILR